MNKIKIIILSGFMLLMATTANNIFAQTLEGVWEGHIVAVNKNTKIPANAVFNWDGNKKWNFSLPAGTWASYDAKLDIAGDYENLTGNYSADDKNNPKNSGHYAFTGSFNFAKKLMVWQPEQKLGGNTKAADTVIRSLTYSQVGNFEYLKGRWAATDGSSAAMEFRRDYGGVPLADGKVKSDFVMVENDTVYFIKTGEFFLALNDDKDGIISKKDGAEDTRKWKFENAPAPFNKAFRIVPVGKDDKCLAVIDGENIVLADKADADADPEGTQYWRFERKAAGVVLVNVKNGGKGIYIEDEGSGKTIIRSRNEAGTWTLEKEN